MQTLLHTRSRPGAWTDWADLQGLDASQLRTGQGFEHLYYLLEAALSFLGLGMPETQPSLGSLIKSGFDYIQSGSWWITLIPGLVLVVLVLVINLLGDWLRDVMNPRLYKG